MNSYIFKSIFRGLRKQKLITIINLLGLSIGLTLVMFISIYLYNEFQADKFHNNAQNIYRVEAKWKTEFCAHSPAPLSGFLKDHFTEIEQSARVFGYVTNTYVTINNRNFETKTPMFVDPSFFKVFAFSVASGNISESFNNKDAIVLTAPLARKLFGKENPIGRSMSFCGKNQFTVAAVLKDLPATSSMQFDVILPFYRFKDYIPINDNWGSLSFQTFILTKLNPTILTENINKAINKQFNGDKNYEREYSLKPLSDIHFSNYAVDYVFRQSEKSELYVFMLVAIGILLIAIVNFINLTVSLSAMRFKENGIRKIEGAGQWQLLFRFIAESVLISMVAALLAALLMELLFPLFNSLLSNPLERFQIREFRFYAGLAGLGLLTGLFAGTYPAYKFSRVSVSTVVRSKRADLRSGKWNNGLLVFQFTASIALIVCTLFLNKQMNFLQNQSLGFDKEQVLYLNMSEDINKQKQVIKEQLLKLPGVEQVCTSDVIPGETFGEWGNEITNKGEKKSVTFFCMQTSSELLNTLGLELIQGRNFDPTRPIDRFSYLVNESFVKKYGLINPIDLPMDGQGKIIGVFKDFNFGSLHQQVTPMAVRFEDSYQSKLMIRVNTSTLKDISSLMSSIRKNILTIAPNAFFEVKFLDNQIQSQYIKEQKTSKLLNYFSFFAIFISCMGLFALAILTINKRTGEIGIRKVNGATISEVMILLNKDFLKWVIIAFILATPVAWYAMHKWLENFAYKTELSWWIFALAGLIALVIALLTVSWQSWKAATSNPVEALRSE